MSFCVLYMSLIYYCAYKNTLTGQPRRMYFDRMVALAFAKDPKHHETNRTRSSEVGRRTGQKQKGSGCEVRLYSMG